MAASDFVSTPQSITLRGNKEARRMRIAIFGWTGVAALVVDLCICGYIVFRQINPRHGYYYDDDNYNTMFKWWHLALLALFGFTAMFIAHSLQESFEQDYEVVRKGTVVGKYTGTAGAYGSTTVYYVTIEGYTRAGDWNRYGMPVKATYWSTAEKGHTVDFGD